MTAEEPHPYPMKVEVTKVAIIVLSHHQAIGNMAM